MNTRQIILDTETTGLEPTKGHRIIEIGCVEMRNRRKTENSFQQYINPEREVDDGAYDVHGLSNDFLSDKPLFKDIAQDFINFVRDSELIIHNAPFDVAFINSELGRLGAEWGCLEDYCQITDSLQEARELHPGQKNSLDALCGRYNVDNSNRELHGAMLDAQILLDVYLAMTGGQVTLSLEDDAVAMKSGNKPLSKLAGDRPRLQVIEPSKEELSAHEKRLREIDQDSDGGCLWKKIEDG